MTRCKIESDFVYHLIWKMSALSTLLGITIALVLNDPIGGYGVFLLGFAHGVVFIPTMIADRCGRGKTVIASILCITYPLWGFLVGMMVFSVAAPFVESFAWGLVVAWALNRPWVILVFTIVGVLSNVSLIVVLDFDLGSRADWGIPQTVGMWYLIVLPVFPLIIRFIPKSTDIPNPFDCVHCGYSLLGLPKDTPCPECGSPRPSVASVSEL